MGVKPGRDANLPWVGCGCVCVWMDMWSVSVCLTDLLHGVYVGVYVCVDGCAGVCLCVFNATFMSDK